VLSSFAGGRLFGERWGSGDPPVVALHGWQRDRRDFAALAQKIEGSLVALDLPGFGATPLSDPPMSTAQVAAVVAEAIEDMGAPVLVVGHSYGGRVALRLAAAEPGLVSGLVLCGVPILRPPGAPRARPPLAFRMARRLHAMGMLGEEAMERTRQRHGSRDYRAAKGALRKVLVDAVNESYEHLLASVVCPVELLWAQDDSEVPPSVAELAAGTLLDANLVVCQRGGHLLPVTSPDELADALRRVSLRAKSPGAHPVSGEA
jgi:pimeloyl-ACP methyl ester carboxylesterase